jgi:hypothetical protein
MKYFFADLAFVFIYKSRSSFGLFISIVLIASFMFLRSFTFRKQYSTPPPYLNGIFGSPPIWRKAQVKPTAAGKRIAIKLMTSLIGMSLFPFVRHIVPICNPNPVTIPISITKGSKAG